MLWIDHNQQRKSQRKGKQQIARTINGSQIHALGHVESLKCILHIILFSSIKIYHETNPCQRMEHNWKGNHKFERARHRSPQIPGIESLHKGSEVGQTGGKHQNSNNESWNRLINCRLVFYWKFAFQSIRKIWILTNTIPGSILFYTS